MITDTYWLDVIYIWELFEVSQVHMQLTDFIIY